RNWLRRNADAGTCERLLRELAEMLIRARMEVSVTSNELAQIHDQLKRVSEQMRKQQVNDRGWRPIINALVDGWMEAPTPTQHAGMAEVSATLVQVLIGWDTESECSRAIPLLAKLPCERTEGFRNWLVKAAQGMKASELRPELAGHICHEIGVCRNE